MDKTEKDYLRKQYAKLRDSLSLEERETKSRLIREQLFLWEKYAKAESVFTYVSFGSEVSTREIIEESLRRGKKLCVPKTGRAGRMEFYAISGLDALRPGKMGILEPEESEPAIPGGNSLFLTPGLVFDKQGNRIGYGAGYYDRYFARYQQGVKIGLAFSLQIAENLPAEEKDVPLDNLLTEDGFLK